MSSGPFVGVARVAFVLTVSLLAFMGLAGSALAHTSLIGSDPADGAVLDAAPTTVTLTFDDSLADLEPAVIVTGPDGGTHQSGPAVVDGAVLSSAVAPLTAAGSYIVAYRVVSGDGHPVEGQVRFEFVGTPSPPAAAPTAGAVSSAINAAATAAGTATSSRAPTSASAPPPPTPTGAAVSTAATPSAEPASRAESAAESTGSWSAWVWAMIAAVVVAAASAFVIRRRLAAGAEARPGDGPDDHRR